MIDEAFEAQRGRLHAVAYRMLGSHADAEDVVQEAWLRLSLQDPATIGNLGGWLTTVVGRISLDVLRSRRPSASYDELVVTVDDGPSPADDAEVADSVGAALLVVLESLRPSERLAFVLHDLFAVPFEEIGQILGRSADATKMLASRARRKVRGTERTTGSAPGTERPPGSAPGTERPDGSAPGTERPPGSAPGTGRPGGSVRAQREVVRAFLAAARGGDFAALLRVLDPEVRLTAETADGLTVTIGATEVAAGARFGGGQGARGRGVLVDGRPGFLAWRADGTPLTLLAFTVVDGRITEIRAISDPARLAALDLPDQPAWK
ncbi:RNA polymerase sigma-70 factor, ECF subfamily [Asanoa hainanensis]|uniref:RNA polymerase sigma-70 factor, ECF subfamily n=1 Tax=Asanoa hainanensis TaxID=560556 RepID=A0A239GWS5_9ACTN|nr:sigma-70 family RNA polymerase sigma factor [Asanoa hainanensis]SNS73342.1 RNA polymerase sigma-70 factor, ECF subfamily [Asanoa hainanensis]